MGRRSTEPPILPPPGWNPPVSDAWAAGLFEGEGCLVQRGRFWSMQLKMTDLDVIQRFQHWAGIGNVLGVHAPSHRRLVQRGKAKPAFTWTASGRQTVPLLQRLRPYLGERRGQKVDAFLQHARNGGWL